MCGGVLVAMGSEGEKYPGEALLWSANCLVGPELGIVAVDLGKSKDMGYQVALAAPEILVLTHDDWDHIGGWEGFKLSGLTKLRELWVPYEWGLLVRVLADLDADEDDAQPEMGAIVLQESAGIYDDGDADLGDESPISEHLESASRQIHAIIRSALSERLGDLLKSLGALGDDENVSDWRGTSTDVAARAASRALQLVAILSAARVAEVRVRYFSTDHAVQRVVKRPWERFHRTSLVTIANAIEVQFAPPRRHSLSSLAFVMRLTIQNRRALCPVLWSWHRFGPAVLVWSDSSGGWAADFPEAHDLLDRLPVMTTPHHGSDNSAHAAAWRALEPFRSRADTVMVLAGGEPTQKRVHHDYLEVPHDRRGCTRCRHEEPQRQGSHAVVTQVFAYGSARILSGGCRE